MKTIQAIIAAVAFASTAYSATLEVDFNGSLASPSSYGGVVTGSINFNASAVDANDLVNGCFTDFIGESTVDTIVTNGFVNYDNAHAPTIGGKLKLAGGGLRDTTTAGCLTIPDLVLEGNSILWSVNGGTGINIDATSGAYALTLIGNFVFGNIGDSGTTFANNGSDPVEIDFNGSTDNQSSTEIDMPGDLHILAAPVAGGTVKVANPYKVYVDCTDSGNAFAKLTCSKVILGSNKLSQDITVDGSGI